MVIESAKQFQEKEALIAALKIIALGEKDRLQGKAFPLLIHGHSCWLPVKAANNGGHHSSRCSG